MRNESFFLASGEELKNAQTTDIYFLRTEDILKKNLMNPSVFVDVVSSSIRNLSWKFVSGMDTLSKLILRIIVKDIRRFNVTLLDR